MILHGVVNEHHASIVIKLHKSHLGRSSSTNNSIGLNDAQIHTINEYSEA